MTTAALLDEVIETLYARHTTDPEASPGPHDAGYLFTRFRDHLRKAT